MEKAVDVLGVHLEPMSGDSIVLLGERNDVTHVLPIFIGPAEAHSIVVGLAGLTPPRPNTHDLMIDALTAFGVEVQTVVITDLVDGTFHAELVLAGAAAVQTVDCRPSDGVALAVRTGAAVRVHEAVFSAAAVAVEHESDASFTDEQIESIVGDFHEYLRTAEPEDFDPGAAEGSGDENPGDDSQDEPGGAADG